MKIVLSQDQQQRLLAWAATHTAAAVDADVEPGGYVLEIEVGQFAEAWARCGSDRLGLGEVEVVLTSH